MTNRREGREGREREGERDRERGSRAKPGIQLVPIYKKGDPQLFENYRPISLLPTISKVLEKIIHKQLSS